MVKMLSDYLYVACTILLQIHISQSLPFDAHLTVQNAFINVKSGSSSFILCHPSNNNPQDFYFYRTESGQGHNMPLYSDVRRLPAPTHSVALIMEHHDDAQQRFGTYTCKDNASESSVTTFKLPDPKLAEVTAFQTFITKNVGEDVLFHVAVSRLDLPLVWLHDQNEVTEWRNETVIRIESVNASNSGIYECFYEGRRHLGSHAFIQLLVRSCAAFKWGENCENNCPSCFNGGLCHDTLGVCICPPGFDGKHCEITCDKNFFGKDCKKKCDYENPVESDEPCATYLFCLPHPYGCGCAAGFRGNLCKEDCDDGFYGSDCTQACHCEGGFTCDKRTGNCSAGCAEGWTGNSCEIETCSGEYYGPNCSLPCSCANGGNCNPVDGTCNCLDSWKGSLCNETAPNVISLEPLEVNAGAEVNLSCTIESSNPLASADILLDNLSDLTTTILAVNDTLYAVIASTNITENITVNCTGTNVYGSTDQQFTVIAIEPPYLKSKPQAENVTENSIMLLWNNWTYGIDGGGKLDDHIEYRVVMKIMNFKWYNDWSSKTTGVQIGQLNPDVEYEVAIQCRRPGVGGDGPFSPSIRVKTNCQLPNGTFPMNLTNIEYGSTFIALKWENVHHTKGVCKNMTYEVTWSEIVDDSANEDEDEQITDAEDSFNLTNLKPSTNYHLEISEFSDKEDTFNITNLRPSTNYHIEISLISDNQIVGTPATLSVNTTTLTCSGDMYGPNCSLACSCANGSECNSNDGSCKCLDSQYGTSCNETVPNVISLEPLEVNAGAEVNLSCIIESSNPLASADILLENLSELTSTTEEINGTLYEVVVSTNVTENITVNCTGTNVHGSTNHQFTVTAIGPPFLKSKPQVVNVTENSMVLSWNNWTFGIDGGGKLDDEIEYRVQIKVNTHIWYNEWSSQTSGIEIGQLNPDVEYEVAIQCRRPGVGGEGPFSPSIYVKTNCQIPTTNGTFPMNLTYLDYGRTFIVLTWENVHYKSGVCNMSYEVTWNAVDDGSGEVRITDNEHALNLTNLKPSTNYHIEISLIADNQTVGTPATISVNTTTSTCSGDNYQQNCSLACSSAIDSECNSVDGLCNCSDSENGTSHIETAPNVLSLEPLEVNAGAEVNLSCIIESTNPLASADILLENLSDLTSTTQEINGTLYEVVVSTNVTENITVNCTGTNVYGSTDQQFTVIAIEQPYLKSKPQAENVTENSIMLLWNNWTYGIDGGGKLDDHIEYRVVMKVMNFKWYNDWSSKTTGVQIGQLNPDVEYEVAIQCRRPGVGGDGPFSPSIRVKTNCQIPNGTFPMNLTYLEYGSTFIALKWENVHHTRGVCKNMTYEVTWNEIVDGSANGDMQTTENTFNLTNPGPTTEYQIEISQISDREDTFNISGLKPSTNYQIEVSLIADDRIVGTPANISVNTISTKTTSTSAPIIISFEPLEVNMGAEVNLSCTIESINPLTFGSIWEMEFPNSNNTVQETQDSRYEVILSRNVTEDMTVNCTGINSYGTASQEFSLTAIDQPYLKSEPRILNKTENEVEIGWDVWTYGTDGGGKFNDDIEYRVVILSSDMYYDWFSDTSGIKIGRLDPDTEYEIAIQCRRPGVRGEGAFSPSVFVTTDCQIPSSNSIWPKRLRCLDYGSTHISLKWVNKHYKRGVCRNTTYEIKWNEKDDISGSKIIQINNTETKFTATNMKPRTNYQFEISLVLDGQVVGIPATISVNTTTTTIGPVENLTTFALTSREVYLTWDKPALVNDTDYYRITIELLEIIGCADNSTTDIQRIQIEQQEVNITHLHPYSTYLASIEAYISEEHGQSTQIKFTTPEDEPDGYPSNLRGLIVSSTEMKFEWDAVFCELINSDSWTYEYGIQNGTTISFNSTTDNFVVLFMDTFANNDTFVVRLVTTHSTSPSAKLQINKDMEMFWDPPHNVNVIKATATTLDIAWDKPTLQYAFLTGYKVHYERILTNHYNPTGSATATHVIKNPSADFITLHSLTPASEYEVEITAVYGDSESKPARQYFETAYVDFEVKVPEDRVSGMLEKPPAPIFTHDGGSVMKLQIFPIQNADEASAYQIIVEDKEHNGILDLKELEDYYAALQHNKLYYITAEVNSTDVLVVYGYNLTLGDSFTYNGYHNVPLKSHDNYRFHVRAMGWKKEASQFQESVNQAELPVAGESKIVGGTSCVIMNMSCVWFIILAVSIVLICLILFLVSLAIIQKRKNGGSLQIQQSEECLDRIGKKGTLKSSNRRSRTISASYSITKT